MDLDLFEWLGERWNPGSWSSVTLAAERQRRRPAWATCFCFGVSAVVLGGIFYMVFAWWVTPTLANVAIAVGIAAFYLLISFFVHPSPDIDNLGWFGGLMDNPFRISDDWNRSVLFLAIVLVPGRFLASSLAEFALTLFSGGAGPSR